MNVSRVHHCKSQEMVAQQFEEPPAEKCTCREVTTYREADEKVKRGEARWVVTARERGTQSVVCSLCKGDKQVKNCANCQGTGTRVVAAVWDTYTTDIVFVSQASVDPEETKYRPSLAMKTPRVATIESEHIERAYVEGVPEAAERIDKYGILIVKEQVRQLVEGVTREEFEELWEEFEASKFEKTILPALVRLEPADNPATGEGRNCDYGRKI